MTTPCLQLQDLRSDADDLSKATPGFFVNIADKGLTAPVSHLESVFTQVLILNDLSSLRRPTNLGEGWAILGASRNVAWGFLHRDHRGHRVQGEVGPGPLEESILHLRRKKDGGLKAAATGNSRICPRELLPEERAKGGGNQAVVATGVSAEPDGHVGN